MDALTHDQKIIAALGGPAKVVELLNIPKLGGQQRVQNWLKRGIPSAVKVNRPDLFMQPIEVLTEKFAQTPGQKPVAQGV